MTDPLSRRRMIAAAGLSIIGTAAASRGFAAENERPQETAAPASAAPRRNAQADIAGRRRSPRYCFNTSTIMGQNLPLEREMEIAAQAGYQAVEPWVRKIAERRDSGGRSLADVKKKVADLGLTVESAIGFAEWLHDDPAKRAAGVEQMKRDMDLVAQIGGKRIAAPPAGATQSPLDLWKVVERYGKILELGRQLGVIPQLELWGGSKTLSRLGEIAFVLAETPLPDACAVLDVIHIARGGSDFAGLRSFNASQLHVFHMNDYPAGIAPQKIGDGQRVYPGDGAAPLGRLMETFREIGFAGYFSLELFNPAYYKQEPLAVAKTGLAKLKSVVEG
jgi:sugar phosphate isomerase/epimerase